jgi:signal peptidase
MRRVSTIQRVIVIAAAVWLALLISILGALGAARVMNLRLEAVNTGSMSPAIPRNSIAAIQPMNTWEIEPGDVIAFRLPSDRRLEVLHRVVRSVRQPSGLFFETKGDANNAADPFLVPDDDVLGRLRSHIPLLGLVARVLQPPAGYVVLVGGPAIAFLISGLVRRFRKQVRRSEAWANTAGRASDPFRLQLIGC